MNVLTARMELITTEPIELIDITPHLHDFCKKIRVKEGVIVVTSQHTTAGIKINEKCDLLEKDLKSFLKKLAPPDENYHHNHEALDGRKNAHSHLLSYLLSHSETVIVKNGDILLGNWQSLFFIELDGPRASRTVVMTYLGT